MIRRLILWVAVMILSGCVYALTGTGASLSVFAACVILPGVSVVLAFAAARRVSVELYLPMGSKKTDAVNGWLKIKNSSLLPLARVRSAIDVKNQLTGESATLKVDCAVAPVATKHVDLAFDTIYCGRFRFSAARIQVFDPFGMIGWKKSIDIMQKRTVLPDTFPITVRLSGSDSPLGDDDVINLDRKGQDYSEPFQIRDYIEGDNLKQVHWKLSQKLDKYIVKDPSLALERALLVFWDKSAAASPAVADTLAEAVMSLCLRLAEEEIPYSLAVGGGEDPIRSITTVEDLYDVVHELLKAQEDDGILQLMQGLGGRRYPLIAYFTSQISKQLPDLSTVGKTTVFLCSETGDGESVGDLMCYTFSPTDYKTALRDVTI